MPGISSTPIFSKLLGHDSVKRHLTKMLEEKMLPSTILFFGPKGVGKKRCAEELAHHIAGSSNPILTGIQVDIHHLTPEGKNDAHSMGAVREMIYEVGLPPFQSDAKVFLIHQAERLTEACMNALLKTLEEPPPNTYLILIAEEIGVFLPTILSRCRPVRFASLTKGIIADYLEREKAVERKEAERIASFCHGSIGIALEILEKKGNKSLQIMQELLQERLMYGLPAWHELFLQLESFDEEEDSADRLFEKILYWYRDLHLIKEGRDLEHLYHSQALDHLKEQAKVLLPPLDKVYEIITKSRRSLQFHVRLRHALESALLQLTTGV